MREAGPTEGTPAGRIRLVVNADDLGLAESVNRGIVETMQFGIVRSASLMVNMGAHDDAIRRLRALVDGGLDVGIGLHFNLVAGPPLTGSRDLADPRTGRFRPLGSLALRAYLGRLDLDAVRDELRAQHETAAALLSAAGLRVTHIDSHRHAHCLPGVYETVLSYARTRDIHHVRHPRESMVAASGGLPGAASSILRFVLRKQPGADDVGFTGFALMGSRDVDGDLVRLLAALPAGTTELMVHPGYDSPELAARDPYRAPRQREVRALTSPGLHQLVRDRRMVLTHFGATARSG